MQAGPSRHGYGVADPSTLATPNALIAAHPSRGA